MLASLDVGVCSPCLTSRPNKMISSLSSGAISKRMLSTTCASSAAEAEEGGQATGQGQGCRRVAVLSRHRRSHYNTVQRGCC